MLFPKHNKYKPLTIQKIDIPKNQGLTLEQVLNGNIQQIPQIPQIPQMAQNNILSIQQKNKENINSSSTDDETYSTDLIETSSESEKSTSSYTKTKSITINSTSSNSGTEISEPKLYWEYGNSGLKIVEFKKKMSRNLAIMYYIDRVFCEYIENNVEKSYSTLFSKDNIYNLKSGIIKTTNKKVNITLTHSKLKGNYNVLEAGYFVIDNINLTEKELKQNSIPSLQSILSHKDNTYHICKIIKIFNIVEMFVEPNVSSNEITFNEITTQSNIFLNELSENKKNKILKSNKKSGFYVKIYNNRAKGFIIYEDIIYYITTDINFTIGNITVRYYTFELKNGKIKN